MTEGGREGKRRREEGRGTEKEQAGWRKMEGRGRTGTVRREEGVVGEINKDREGEWEKRGWDCASKVAQKTVMSIIRHINYTSAPTHVYTLLHTHTHTHTDTHAQSRVLSTDSCEFKRTTFWSCVLDNQACILHPKYIMCAVANLRKYFNENFETRYSRKFQPLKI